MLSVCASKRRCCKSKVGVKLESENYQEHKPSFVVFQEEGSVTFLVERCKKGNVGNAR